MSAKIKESIIDLWRWVVRSSIDSKEIDRDVDAMLWSASLCDIYRYSHQRFWERETSELEYATKIQGMPRMESVADHSWHLADIVLTIFHRFEPQLNLEKCLTLAILHDKLEIITGDKNPVGRDGTGRNTHAFNPIYRRDKDNEELDALMEYSKLLSDEARSQQLPLFQEMIKCDTQEARFVKGLDKLHPLIFINRKKKGHMHASHVEFTLRYSALSFRYFSPLEPYYRNLAERLMSLVAEYRGIDPDNLEKQSSDEQLCFSFFSSNGHTEANGHS